MHLVKDMTSDTTLEDTLNISHKGAGHLKSSPTENHPVVIHNAKTVVLYVSMLLAKLEVCI